MRESNEEILYGSDELFSGMHLRLPVKALTNTWNYTYETVYAGVDTLEKYAKKYNTFVGYLLHINEDILAGNSTLNNNM